MNAPPRHYYFIYLVVASAAPHFSTTPAIAQLSQEATVEKATERGIQALLNRIRTDDLIQYRKKKKGRVITVRGRVTSIRNGIVELKTDQGKKVFIRKGRIVVWKRAGYIDPEQPELFYGGPSALTAFALLTAGVPTTHPKMKLLIDALAKDDTKKVGTYVHGLRASVWSALLDGRTNKSHRRKYRRLLRQDMSWLTRAMNGQGSYGYGLQGGAPDNSNTQFANLGLWAGAIVNIEVASRLWERIANYWIKCQDPSGAWPYRIRSKRISPSMTVAGCNSLYIVLDRFYSRADEPYQYFEGASPNKAARKKMERIYRSIEDGDKFLELHPPNIIQFRGYELFGLERLGLTSGQARIGGQDWFRHYAPIVARREWGKDPIADAFALIFLVHGQAPVLMQKLEHGKNANNWNYYHRDLFSLMRYMTRTFERLVRWQRIPANASIQSLQDAPILYISGNRKLKLPSSTQRRIRRYIDQGGTVFLHADRAGNQFVESATEMFEKMFADRKLRFEQLEESHPLYRCHFDGGEKGWKRPVPFSALADGPRLLAILCPVDIAGAWHQDRRKLEELFQIMANVRVYCAPAYHQLPKVLRSSGRTTPFAPERGTLSLKRVRHQGEWDAHLGVWERQRVNIHQRTGIKLQISEDDKTLKTKEMQKYDLLHLTTRGSTRLDRKLLTKLTNYLKNGGLLLIDSADGQSAGNAAVLELVNALKVGQKDLLPKNHSMATGAVPGGHPLNNLETTRAGTSLQRANAPPPIIIRTIDGRVAVVACPFDLVAGLDGHFIWNRVGYSPKSTAYIVDNILLWRLQENGTR
ncbi:MAG: DUF4159 domain-containing protein [Phycisphaerales bacterium]|nr:DUF4159 domain-containing protein [Phycisphaerales bacterium]